MNFKTAYRIKYRFTSDRLYLTLTINSLYFLEPCNLNLLLINSYSYLILKKVYSDILDTGEMEEDFIETVDSLYKIKGLEHIESREYELYFTLIVEDVDVSTEEKYSDNWRYDTHDANKSLSLSNNSFDLITHSKKILSSELVFASDLRDTILDTLELHFFLVFKNSKIGSLSLIFPRTGTQCNLVLINSDVKLNSYSSNCKITLVKSSIVTVSSKLLLVPSTIKDEDLSPMYLVNERFKSKSDDTMYYEEDKEKDYRLYYGSKRFIYYEYSVSADNIDCRFNEFDTEIYVNMDKDSNILHCNEDFEIAAFFSGADHKVLRAPLVCELVENSVVEIELTKQYVEFKKAERYLSTIAFY